MDELHLSTLFDIQALERVISMKLSKLIDKNMNYKDVYKKIKSIKKTLQVGTDKINNLK